MPSPKVEMYTPELFWEQYDIEQEVGFINARRVIAPGGSVDQSADIAAALNLGQRIYFDQGNYLIDPDVSMYFPRDNQELILHPGATFNTKPTISGTYEQFRMVGRDNITIRGGVFVGDKLSHLGSDGEWGHVFDLRGSSHITFENCTFKDAWGDLAYLGINGSDPCEYVHFVNCHFINGRRNNISIIHARQVIFERCISEGAIGTNPESGLDMEPNTGNTIEEITVLGCLFQNNNDSGLDIIGANGTTRDVNIISSYFVSNGRNGINIDQAQRVNIQNCVLKLNGTSGVIGDGIRLRGVNGATLAGNIVFDNFGNGIYLADNCKDIAIVNNIVRDHADSGIRPGAASTNTCILISGNRCRGNGHGIRVEDSADRVNIINNVCLENTSTQINVHVNATNIVQDNNIVS